MNYHDYARDDNLAEKYLAGDPNTRTDIAVAIALIPSPMWRPIVTGLSMPFLPGLFVAVNVYGYHLVKQGVATLSVGLLIVDVVMAFAVYFAVRLIYLTYRASQPSVQQMIINYEFRHPGSKLVECYRQEQLRWFIDRI